MGPPSIAALCCAALARPALGARAFVVGAFLRPPPGRRAALERRTAGVSDPGSAEYGRYLSQDELAEAVGVADGTVRQAAEWLAKAFGGQRDPRILTHRDVVSLTLPDFYATYQLGANLSGACPVCEDTSPTLPLPPDAVELVVTPPMPSGFCKGLTKSGESACSAHPPCKWESKKKSKARCKGDFAGWICWPKTLAGPTTKWSCFEPAELLAGDARLPRRRRRGRRWPAVAVADGREAAGADGPEPRMSPSLGFRVIPKSEGLLLLFKQSSTEAAAKPANKSLANASEAPATRGNATWHSLELTFRQEGVYRSQVIQRTDFTGHGRGLLAAKIQGLANLRPVDRIAVCLHMEPSSDGGAAEPSEGPKQGRCDCNASTGMDGRLGRRCEVLLGVSPADKPVGFVLPRSPQSLSALQRDLGIPPGSRAAAPGASQAVAEFNDEAFMQLDVELLHLAFGLRRPAGKIDIQGPDGKPGKRDDFATAGEGSLDAQVITALAPGSPTSWVAVDPYCMDGFMLAYASHLNHHASPPLVHSVSWGDAEALFPPAFVQRLDYELMKLALRGLTVIIASGDNGISSTTTDCSFIPDIVGSSPWVTTVGATLPSLDSAPYCSIGGFSALGECEEPGPIACATAAGAIITSSGYWSIYRGRPSYQDAAVEAYVRESSCRPCRTGVHEDASERAEELNVPCQHISESGCRLGPMVGPRRGSPDVALPGNSYPVVVNLSLGLMDGTSASAPAFAAMVSLLNSEQLSRGRPPLGLLNPWLYRTSERHPEAFADVVVGSAGSTESQLCGYGWSAVPGWDPVTGLGVPIFTRLREHLPGRGPPAAQAAAAASEARPPMVEPAAGGAVLGGLAAAAALALTAVALGTTWRRGSGTAYWDLPGGARRSLLCS